METKADKINRYHNGKIYTLRSHQTDMFYIGSTTDALHKRLYGHKQDYNRWKKYNIRYITSCEMIKYDDCYIELLENFKCETKSELTKREGELIRSHKSDLVNIRVDGRTKHEYWHGEFGKIQNENRKNTKAFCEVCDKEIRKDSMKDHLVSKRHIKKTKEE